MSKSVSRHLSRIGLEEYVASAAPAYLVVPGDPVCQFLIDPPRGEISLRTPHKGSDAGVKGLENITYDTHWSDGRTWSRVVVSYHLHPYEAYVFLCDVSDLVQGKNLMLGAATLRAFSSFKSLISPQTALSAEQQTGLFGELCFLEHCLSVFTADDAVEAWKGFASNEHDFVFGDASYELKTTRLEKRVHTIGSLEQLTASSDVPLWLISMQITSATSQSGRTLPGLIDAIVANSGPARALLDARLLRAGWRESDRLLYEEYFSLRSNPRAFEVDSAFPHLTRERLRVATPRSALIVDASYRLDLSALKPSVPPSPAASFVEGPESYD